MKIYIICICLICAFTSCKPKVGTLETKLAYYYNDFKGYKQDVAAKVFLYQFNDKPLEQSIIFAEGLLKYKGEQVKSPDFKGEAGIDGLVKIDGIPYGKYHIIVSSAGRSVYSIKTIEINKPLTTLTKNFGYKHENAPEGESW